MNSGIFSVGVCGVVIACAFGAGGKERTGAGDPTPIPVPVYRLVEVGDEHADATIRGVRRLPIGAGQAWTINMFVWAHRWSDVASKIAGFGRLDDATPGVGRYLGKFGSAIHFRTGRCDVEARTAPDLDRWHMLTATYDGTTVRVYQDGEMLTEQGVSLADDEPVITILPTDLSSPGSRFDGLVREFSIWGAALDQGTLKRIHDGYMGK